MNIANWYMKPETYLEVMEVIASAGYDPEGNEVAARLRQRFGLKSFKTYNIIVCFPGHRRYNKPVFGAENISDGFVDLSIEGAINA
jgi:DNA-binding LacI/PurR family transcriptional regulator